ncbi:MAG: NAD-dependent epimerase/dehydratase family protein, partial [Candidatus Binatia bacterium]
ITMSTGRVVVTGAAGFIGSHLVEALLNLGHHVIGVDSFTDYYAETIKHRNLARALEQPRFQLARIDLTHDELESMLKGVDLVFHLAAQPGVRTSWSGFRNYVERNTLATQRLLEACRSIRGLRFVNASSSSVYGNYSEAPMSETCPTKPFNPYGVTKLAAEQLCSLYGANGIVWTVSLRYFTVYGPRQRPDMATYRMIEAAARGTTFPLLGDGSQVRDFTFVDDVVQANLRAAFSKVNAGSVYNIAAGSSRSVADVITLVSSVVGRPVKCQYLAVAEGDPACTGADISRAAADLGWRPLTKIDDGIAAQVAWQLV